MKKKTLMLVAAACAAALVVGGPGWGKKQPPPTDPPPTPVEGYYFWRLGHMEGPHDSSKTLGISRDGKTAVGSTLVVDFQRAWRCDIDWAIATDDGVPPLFNELKVQEDIGIIAPSQPSAAYASSDMTTTPTGYDLPNLVLDWGGSMPVGTITGGTVSYGIQWLLPVLDSVDEGDFVQMPDFGGGASDMAVKDVSADGFILVGTGNTRNGQQAFRADTRVVDENLVPIPVQLVIQDFVTLQTLRASAAEAVSADGTIIAGYGSTNSGNRAFVTTSEDWNAEEPVLVTTILPKLGGGKYAEAYGISSDGTIIVGRSDSPKGPQACIWFRDETQTDAPWVVKGLGGLSKKSLDSVATGVVRRPGSLVGELMVVGRSKSILYPEEAFVWTGNPVLEDDGIGYMYDLEYILTKTGVAEASSMGSDWILNQATGVALDGDGETRVVGWGTNPEGGIEAWLVTGYPYDELVFVKE